MSIPALDSASTVLLHLLDHLPPFTGTKVLFGAILKLPEAQTTTLGEHRQNIEALNEKLEKCSWATAVLLHSLEDIGETRSILMERRGWHISEANRLAADQKKSIRLPNELLSLVARYVHPEPISAEEAFKLKSSGCKWEAIVLKASLVRLDEKSFESFVLPSYLAASSPAKMVVDMGGSIPTGAFQTLLPFVRRWHTLTVEDGSWSDALSSERCPNCLSPPNDGPWRCEDHKILSSVRTLTTSFKNWPVPSASRWFRHLKHLGLVIKGQQEEASFDYSGLASGLSLLEELTVSWWNAKPRFGSPGENGPKAFFPRLRRVSYVHMGGDREDGVEFAFTSLRGDRVEEFCGQILDAFDHFPGAFLESLDQNFPSVVSLALRAVKLPRLQVRETYLEILEWQAYYLERLHPNAESDYEGPVLPHLTHLSIELDFSQKGTDALLDLLFARHDQEPSLKEIRSLELFTPARQDTEIQDFLCRVQACVQHLTVCVAPVGVVEGL